MHLIEIFLPVVPGGKEKTTQLLGEVRAELTERFGGITIFSRVPAEGIVEHGNKSLRDEIMVVEVMTDDLSKKWWSKYRRKLEARFDQDEILIRASSVETL
jgi:hypothetical protein